MNVKTWIPLALAVMLGLVAAVVGRNMILVRRTASGPERKMVSVVMARNAVAPGQELRPDDLRTSQIMGDKVPGGMFGTIEELAGRVAVSQIAEDQPVLETLLAPRGVGAGLQALVPDGMRAVSMEVNEFKGFNILRIFKQSCRPDFSDKIF